MSTITESTWHTVLHAQHACADAMAWAEGYETFEAAWAACARGDWMLWWIGRVAPGGRESVERKRLVLVACQCARLALPYVRTGDDRPLKAIQTTERWARDEGATLTEVRVYAADAAAAAAAAAYAGAAADAAAAYAAAAAADAAYAAADAPAAAAAAVYAAAAAAAAVYAAAAADAKRSEGLKQCADLVRASYPLPLLPRG